MKIPSCAGPLLGVFLIAGCAESRSKLPGPGGDDGSTDGPGINPDSYVLRLDAAPLQDAVAGEGGACVPEGSRKQDELPDSVVTSIAGETYTSNPPSSGPHCAVPAALGASATPTPRCNWLASLEQGAVVLLYNCPTDCDGGCGSGCDEIAATLRRINQRLNHDSCPPDAGTAEGYPTIVSPDPDLDVTVAAVAWGYTWKSDCLDSTAQQSLIDFVNAHLGSRGSAPGRPCQ